MISPAFSFYAKDWLAATMAWPLEARGAYVTLLAYQWDAGWIPVGPEALARLLGVSTTKARKLWTIIGDKFTIGPSGSTAQNTRLERERTKQQQYRVEAAEAGKRGAAKRWGSHSPPHRPPHRPPHASPQWGLDGSSSSSSGISEDGNSPPNPPRGGLKVRREHRDQAKAILNAQLGYCQHDPPCQTQAACFERLAREIAQKAIA